VSVSESAPAYLKRLMWSMRMRGKRWMRMLMVAAVLPLHSSHE